MLPSAALVLPWFLPGLAVLLGLLVGSFLNVVIYRLPLMMDREWRQQCAALLASPTAADPTAQPDSGKAAVFNLLRPRSACPACKTPIKARHNIPVLGWLWLRGRCAACRAAIPARYPVVEAATGLVSGFVVWHFGYTPESIAALGITWTLIALALIDVDTQLLPDAMTLPLLWAGLLFHLLTGPHPDSSPFATNLTDGVIGAMAGYLSLRLVYEAHHLLTGKEGMGFGDFKLFAALLAWFGYQMFLPILLLSALAGSVTGITLIALGRHEWSGKMPFGLYLAAAGFVALVWGQQLVATYPFLDPFHRVVP